MMVRTKARLHFEKKKVIDLTRQIIIAKKKKTSQTSHYTHAQAQH